MNKCESCHQGMIQLDLPGGLGSQFHLCTLCGGTGKERIVQILQIKNIVTNRPNLLGLTSNGRLCKRSEKEWVDA